MYVRHCIVVSVTTTVRLDDDVYEEALRRSKATGRSLGAVLSEMARHALRSNARPMRNAEQGIRFPSFDVPPDTPQIPASRVQKAIDENGIV